MTSAMLAPSLEVTSDDLEQGDEALADCQGMSVFVAHFSEQSTQEIERTCRQVHERGAIPVPHLTVRSYLNAEHLANTVDRLCTKAGVVEALVLAGDGPVTGDLPDTLAALDSGVLAQTGLKRLWFAGYPEGHPHIDSDLLEEVLQHKLQYTQDQGLLAGVVTQLAQTSEVIRTWYAERRFEQQKVVLRASVFLRANPKIASSLGLRANMPWLCEMATHPQTDGLIHGSHSYAQLTQMMAAPDRAVHVMALGALCETHAAIRAAGKI